MSCRIHRWFASLLMLLVMPWFAMPQAAATTQGVVATYSNEERLTQMLVLDISERLLDGQPALAISFSQDLDPSIPFNNFVTLTRDGKAVSGQWQVAREPQRLYFSNIQPQIEYRVQIRPGIASDKGLLLKLPVNQLVTTRDIQPAFDFASRGSILPATLHDGLPIRVLNVPEVDLEFLRVQPENLAEVLKRIRLSERLAQWHLQDIHGLTQSVFSQRYVTNTKQNAGAALVIPLQNISALTRPGLYFAVMRQPGHFNDAAYRINPFVVTNIGLHVRSYPRGLEVFVHALDSGKPLEGVSLHLQGDKELVKRKTDSDGRVSFRHRPKGDLLLSAIKDGQFAFLDLRDAPLDLSEYPVQGLVDRALAPFFYSSRDWMRPGETLDFSLLLRNRDGYPLPMDRVQLRITRPDGKVWLDEPMVASYPKLGFFKHALTLPATVLNGAWRAEVRLNPQDVQPAAELTFRVESVLPERMTLTLSSGNKPVANGEKWLVSVQGNYFHGEPASGNSFSAVRTARLNRHPLPKFETYYFGDPADGQKLGRVDLPALILSEAGSAFLEVPGFEGKVNSPLILSIAGELQEQGGRSTYQALETRFWPEQSLVGIDPLFDDAGSVVANGEANFALVRVNAAGEPSAGTRPLVVTLVREQPEYVTEYHATQGWVRRVVLTSTPVNQQKIRLDAQGHGNVRFAVLQTGRYRLEVEDAETGLKAVYPFKSGWESLEASTQRPDQITLSLDKASYRAGEQAKLRIDPPLAGEAIVTVEGESMLWSQRVSLPARGTEVTIPVDKAWNRHDLYVTVSAFHPLNKAQQPLISRSFGAVFLPMEREQRRLNVTLETDDKWIPEQTVGVTLNVANLAKQSAVVTLAAVDSKVLQATGFTIPDPFTFYFAQHAYSVKVHDAYGSLIKGIEGAVVDALTNVSSESSVSALQALLPARSMAVVSETVVFDDAGTARLELPLPAFEGQLRLMAVVASADRFGSVQREVSVRSPVALQVSAPTFLTRGSRGLVTIDVRNTTETPQVVELKLSADSRLDLTPEHYELSLERGQTQQWRIPVSAKQVLGEGKVNVMLTGTTFRTQRQVPVMLRSAFGEKYASQRRELKPGESLALDASVFQGFAPESAQVHLSMAPTPVLPIRSLVTRLLRLPAVSLEQHISRAWLHLSLDAKAAEGMGLESLTAEQRDAQVKAAVLQLAMEQLESGGFSLWGGDEDAEADVWLTAYAVDFLLDAKARGIKLPDGLLARAVRPLQTQLTAVLPQEDTRYPVSEMPEHLNFATRAYALYVLSRYDKQQLTLSQLQVMHDKERRQSQAGLPLVHLGLALNTLGDTKRGATAIAEGLAMARDDKLYAGDYGSRLRDDAVMLLLLLRNKSPVAEQAGRLVQFMDTLHNRTVLSSQELLFASLLGLHLQAVTMNAWEATLQIGDEETLLASKGMQSRALSVDALQSGVKLTAIGERSVFVNIAVDGYPSTIPALDTDPVEVTREWYTMQGQKVTPEDVKVGDLLLVQLTLRSARAVHDAVVVDMLPVGFEIENTALGDYSSLADLPLEGGERTVAELSKGVILYSELLEKDRYLAALALQAKVSYRLFYRVRVVAAADTIIPPPRVSSLYRPEVNGVGLVGGALSIAP
ncbi:alpha-2-macroglobulin family protein [Candidatus Thiothrix anitrata]|uniref:Alpha-2-macroglobulin n=1 Tax=Candidatus Thiothrix anitrata TaxID=2823902 RepID=A0ABX7X1R1_9GAMM|nr:alpha-2-macroglobulin [Candidatus Thiothrix anitrata]QTR49805.1 alpha-2-macroglobulin family protein [Candidatus Thiothrix anitrata]